MPGYFDVDIQTTTNTQNAKNIINIIRAKNGAIDNPGKLNIHLPASSKSAAIPDNFDFR